MKKFQNPLFVPLTFDSIMSFCLSVFSTISKSLKFFHNLVSRSPLNPLIKLNSLLLKILFFLRIGKESILFLVLLVILVIMAKQRDGWKTRVDKHRRKMKRVIASQLLLIAGLQNHYFSFNKVTHVSSISSSHFNFHEAFYTLENSNNLINDFSFISVA